MESLPPFRSLMNITREVFVARWNRFSIIVVSGFDEEHDDHPYLFALLLYSFQFLFSRSNIISNFSLSLSLCFLKSLISEIGRKVNNKRLIVPTWETRKWQMKHPRNDFTRPMPCKAASHDPLNVIERVLILTGVTRFIDALILPDSELHA